MCCLLTASASFFDLRKFRSVRLKVNRSFSFTTSLIPLGLSCIPLEHLPFFVPRVVSVLRPQRPHSRPSTIIEGPVAFHYGTFHHAFNERFRISPAFHVSWSLLSSNSGRFFSVAQFSKIDKIMRHINALADGKIPNNNQYKFRERAKALVDRWHQVLIADQNQSTNGVTEGTAKMDLNRNSNAGEVAVLARRDIWDKC
ncbi:hypothetical protein F5146DRAFT_972155 [Armillaria mellea]|nr:hypothetical protein F5146DRAFT_972155 [Armillaria mellea]